MTETSTRILGILRRLDERVGAVRVEDVYETGIEDLWDAVSTSARLVGWLGEVTGDLRLGGTFQATFRSSWTGTGRVEACEAPHHLRVTLEPGTQDETEIEAWLSAEGDRTRLVVEERGLPVEVLPAHGAGWQAHVEDLAHHLDGCGDGDWRTRWSALIPAYREIAPA
ncbi:MAG: SRPBCC family protein [Marmoricola sp.]